MMVFISNIKVFIGVFDWIYLTLSNRVFRNVGIYNSDAGELPRRKHTIILSTVYIS